MQRLASTAGGVLLVGTLVASGVELAPLVGPGWLGESCALRQLPAALPGLAALALAGRVLLAWLPPGAPGARQAGSVAATWAVSLLLGALALPAEHVALSPLLGRGGALVACLVTVAVLAGLRLASLPGAMVPRHPPPPLPPTAGGRAATLALVAAALAPWLVAPPEAAGDPSWTRLAAFPRAAVRLLEALGAHRVGAERVLAATHATAVLALLAHGLRVARRAPVPSRLAVAAYGLLGPVLGPSLVGWPEAHAAVGIAAAVVFATAWLRRADRRSAWVAVLAASAPTAALPLGALVSAALLAVWVRTAPDASRRFALALALGALALLVLPGLALGWTGGVGGWGHLDRVGYGGGRASDYGLAALGVLAGLRWLARPPAATEPWRPGRPAPVGSELLFAAGAAVSACLHLGPRAVLAAPAVALFAGLLLLPTESSEAGAGRGSS